MRSANGYLFAGTSDGNIHIYNEKTLEKVKKFIYTREKLVEFIPFKEATLEENMHFFHLIDSQKKLLKQLPSQQFFLKYFEHSRNILRFCGCGADIEGIC